MKSHLRRFCERRVAGNLLLPVVAAPALLFALAASVSPASAEFSLAPLRQLVTDEAPVARYTVSNPSPRRLEASVSWIDLEATAEGYRPAAPATRERMSAAPYLTVTPTTISLGPGERAEIVVSRRLDRAPPAGERRSHLLISADAARTPQRKAGFGMQADIGLSISTPVILRMGPGRASARLGGTRLVRAGDGSLDLETRVELTGSFSTFGRVVVGFAPASGKPVELARVRNVAAYRETAYRLVSASLGTATLPTGRITVRYEGEGEFEGEVFDERMFDVEGPADG